MAAPARLNYWLRGGNLAADLRTNERTTNERRTNERTNERTDVRRTTDGRRVRNLLRGVVKPAADTENFRQKLLVLIKQSNEINTLVRVLQPHANCNMQSVVVVVVVVTWCVRDEWVVQGSG